MKQYLILLLLCLPLGAQTLTQILDTYRNPDGTLYKGTIQITPGRRECALAVGEESYSLTSKIYCIGVTGTACGATTAAGVIDISLVPNQGAQPTGCYYVARFAPDNYTQYWVVPATGPVNLKAVRIASADLPSPSARFLWTQIDWSGFTCASVPALCGIVGGQSWSEMTLKWSEITSLWSEL